MKALLEKQLPAIPAEIRERLDHPCITMTPFEDRNDILSDRALQQEVGYQRFPDGSWLVSMTCPMPGITPEMIEWWFWWHCQDSLRYQVWYPGAHLSITYGKKDRAYFEQKTQPAFQPNAQYPLEKIGDLKMTLRIDFVTPEAFGFSRQTMEENDIATVVCGHVSACNGLVPNTEMAHVFRRTEDGLFMFSRFWLGKTLPSFLRRIIMTDRNARGMAEHCCIEYRNLVQILPGLYEENHRSA